MATHAFNHPSDLAQGGTWCGICRWTWDTTTKALRVISGRHGKLIDLRGADLNGVDLRERLPQIALEVARRIAGGS